MTREKDIAFEEWDNSEMSPLFMKAIDNEDWDFALREAFHAGWDASNELHVSVPAYI